MRRTAAEIAEDIRERREHLEVEAARLRRIADELDAEREALSGALDALGDGGADKLIGIAQAAAKPGEVVGVALQGGVAVGTVTDVQTTLTGAAKAAKAPKRKGRPRGSGQRDKDVLRVLTLGAKNGHPEMSVNEIASALGIKPNYLYRVLPKLAEEGKVEKVGQAWKARVEKVGRTWRPVV